MAGVTLVERPLVVLPTYNEAVNLRRAHPAISRRLARVLAWPNHPCGGQSAQERVGAYVSSSRAAPAMLVKLSHQESRQRDSMTPVAAARPWVNGRKSPTTPMDHLGAVATGPSRRGTGPGVARRVGPAERDRADRVVPVGHTEN